MFEYIIKEKSYFVMKKKNEKFISLEFMGKKMGIGAGVLKLKKYERLN